MNICDSNANVEALYQFSEKESPPFALDDQCSSLQDQHGDKFCELFDEISNSKHSELRSKDMEIDSRCVQFIARGCGKHHLAIPSYPENSSHSLPPDLTESVTTEGTSFSSVFSAPKSDSTKSKNQETKATTSPPPSRSGLFQASIVSTSSLTSVPLVPRLPRGEYDSDDNGNLKATSASSQAPHMIIVQSDKNSSSIGFSELMEAADDSNIHLEKSRPATILSDHRSSEKLPPLLENQEVESGALISVESQEVEPNILISAPPVLESIYTTVPSTRRGRVGKWWHNMPLVDTGAHGTDVELQKPLLSITRTATNTDAHRTPHVTRLLSSETFQDQYINLALERASTSVQTQIEGEDSFEVSLLVGEDALCTVDDVMDVIGNADLLNLWCSPIENIIVTSSSNEVPCSAMNFDGKKNNEACGRHVSSICNIREYEAEWIEATTSSLESPSSNVGFFLSAGRSALENLGCASYGRITMFIERQHGRVGLTIGPFHGGIHASHSISVSLENSNSNGRRIRIVDRVRLARENEEEEVFAGGILGCAMGSCISHFFLPSISGYIDQVTLSMARLRVLLENRGSVRSGNRPCF